MKKRNNKKGFTIVELVIVIAVIGILAGVLIPTFSGIQQSAKESAAFQECKNVLSSVLALNGGAIPANTLFAVDTDKKPEELEYKFYYANQKLGDKQPESYTTNSLEQSANEYIVYVSASAMKLFLDNNGVVKTDISGQALDATELGMIKTVLGIAADKTTTYAKNTDGDVVATIDGKKVTLHYTSDIKSSIVVFLAKP